MATPQPTPKPNPTQPGLQPESAPPAPTVQITIPPGGGSYTLASDGTLTQVTDQPDPQPNTQPGA